MAQDSVGNDILSNILGEMRRQRDAFRGAFRSDPTARSRTREEARERAKKLRDAVEKGFGVAFKKTGLSKLASSVGNFAKMGGKGILLSAALVAFFAFVNSPFFDKFVDFLRDKIIPGIAKLIKWLDDNGVNIENAIRLISAAVANVGSLITNVVDFFKEPSWDKFKKIIDENLGTLGVVIGLLAPKLLLGGLLASVKLLGGAFALLGTRLGNVNVPTPPTGPTPTMAQQVRARGATATPAQLRAAGLVRATDGSLRESGIRSGTRFNQIPRGNSTLLNARLDQAGVRQFRPPRGTPNAAIARQFPRIAKLMRFMGPLMAIASVAQVYSLLGSEKSKQEKLKGVASIFGGLGGGLLGAKMGGLLGLFGGPFGAVIGSVAGGIGGYLAGDHLGDLLARYILGENLTIDDVLPMGLGELLMKKGTALAESIAAGDKKTADARTAQATQNLKVKPMTKEGFFQGRDAISGKKGRLQFGALSREAKKQVEIQVANSLKNATFVSEKDKILREQSAIQKILTKIATTLEITQGQGTVMINNMAFGKGAGKGGSDNPLVMVPMGSPKTQNQALNALAGFDF